MGTTPIYGFPYPDPSDLVANYPALGQDLAEEVETVIAASAGKIKQVVSVVKTNSFTMTSTTFADVTGLAATITPTSNTSKVLVLVQTNVSTNDASSLTVFVALLRGSTVILQGDAAGSRRRATQFSGGAANGADSSPVPITYLDSPATTSATTYKIQIAGSSAVLAGVNRAWGDTDAATYGRSTSTITLMEVGA